jgi:hypothetical protein
MARAYMTAGESSKSWPFSTNMLMWFWKLISGTWTQLSGARTFGHQMKTSCFSPGMTCFSISQRIGSRAAGPARQHQERADGGAYHVGNRAFAHGYTDI